MTKKAKFLQKFNEAFANNDTETIVKNITEDICWNIIGDRKVQGKEAFTETLKAMVRDEPLMMNISNIITHGASAAVNGTMKSADHKIYAFCDVYKFKGFKNPSIKEITSYVVELKQ